MRAVHLIVLASALGACSAGLTSKAAAPPAAQRAQLVPSDSILYFLDGVRQATGKAFTLEVAAIESLSVVKRHAARGRFGPQVKAVVFIYLKRAR